jgi:RNA polymerase sigma factor (sigma-70 family)
MRKDGRRGEVAELEEESRGVTGPGHGDVSGATNRDLRISLEQAIDRSLTDREALAVKLIYFEGFTYREVAERLETTVGAMSGLVFRALAKLRSDGGVTRHWEEA